MVLSRYGQIIKHSIKNSHGYVDFGVSEVAEKLIEESKRQPGIVLGENYRLRSKWYLTPEVSASRCRRAVVADTVLQPGTGPG